MHTSKVWDWLWDDKGRIDRMVWGQGIDILTPSLSLYCFYSACNVLRMQDINLLIYKMRSIEGPVNIFRNKEISKSTEVAVMMLCNCSNFSGVYFPATTISEPPK